MAESEMLVQMISTLGFPIVMVCYFAWYTVKRDQEHREEINKMSEALNNNTLALTKLVENLEKGVK